DRDGRGQDRRRGEPQQDLLVRARSRFASHRDEPAGRGGRAERGRRARQSMAGGLYLLALRADLRRIERDPAQHHCRAAARSAAVGGGLMNFAFTDEQIELRDGVRAYLEGTHGAEVLRRLDTEGGRDPVIWRGLVEMGLTALIVPEAQGGLGLGLIEAALVAVELGRADVSEPVADSALVAPRLIADEAQLAAIAAGELKVALAHPV